MKNKLLHIAITMALSSAVFSGSVLSTQAYADDQITNNDSNNQATSENYLYPGMGVGAATGTLIAGPVGLVIGGLVGALLGSTQEVSDDPDNLIDKSVAVGDQSISKDNIDSFNNIEESALVTEKSDLASLQVAQLGSMKIVEDAPTASHTISQQDKLLDILTTDLSLDVYFRSGSTDIESFYPARLLAIASLLENMDQLELHLDGYTDRRGNRLQNIALANQRIEMVRQKLIDSGVDENRITSKAFGEMKMVSSAGDLEAYTFDRKVVIRFERSDADSIHAMTVTLSGMTPAEPGTDEAVTSASDESTGSVVADATARF